MLDKFLPRQDFSSYEDFYENFKIIVPENFNFAYDVVDAIAAEDPERNAMVWCNDRGDEARFSFAEMRYYSDKAANFFKSHGIGKGDPVMLILKRRYEFWFCLLGLHKLGAICIPATHLLTKKDIVYRCNAADIKMIVCVAEDEVIRHVEDAAPESPTLVKRALVGGSKEGWIDFNSELNNTSGKFDRPSGSEAACNNDIMLLYFTSGTTGMPKMVQHDFTYPLGHILTAKYWQNVSNGGLHLTVADTGWAKAMWGKIYGQWLSGASVFVYDYDKFAPCGCNIISNTNNFILRAADDLQVFIKEDLTKYDLSSLKDCSIAGEPLNPEVYYQFLKATGLELREGYGQTELTVTIATYPWMKPKPGSMGKPSPGYAVALLNDEGKPCEIGEEGQVVIYTDKSIPVGMFKGYYRDPELTGKVWNNDIYYTGDMAWKDEDGYYWFVGRADDLIKSSGYRIGPFEVESSA